jgi:hypothetical protein
MAMKTKLGDVPPSRDGQPPEKRFRVSGKDAEGDIHLFLTDSHERAKAMRDAFAKDCSSVTLDEKTYGIPIP